MDNNSVFNEAVTCLLDESQDSPFSGKITDYLWQVKVTFLKQTVFLRDAGEKAEKERRREEEREAGRVVEGRERGREEGEKRKKVKEIGELKNVVMIY